MTEYRQSPRLTNERLQEILGNERIRRHLIDVGLINHRGEIISENRRQYRSKPRRNTLGRSYQRETSEPRHSTFIRRPLTSVSPRRALEKRETFRRSAARPANPHANEQRQKSASTAQSKQTNNTSKSTRLSSSNQFTCEQNVLLRRAVSPKIIAAGERCMVGIKYFGPEMNIEYDREWFEPNGDEILIMQQHCGGENLLVFKGSLKPDEQFLFHSRRHIDYPFALAFYVNGVIENRLSVCCEARWNNTRIGGRHGVFAIVSVSKATACRRCRFEQRMKQIKEAEEKSEEAKKQGQTPISPSKPVHPNSSNSNGVAKGDSKPLDTHRPSSASNGKPAGTQSPTTQSNGTHLSNTKPVDTHRPSSASNDKPVGTHSPTTQPNGTHLSDTKPVDTHRPISASNGKPAGAHSPTTESNGMNISKSKPINRPPSIAGLHEENSSSSKDDQPRSPSPEPVSTRRSPPKPTRIETPSSGDSPKSNQSQDRSSKLNIAASEPKEETPVRELTPTPPLNRPNLVRDILVAGSPLRSIPNGMRRSSRESNDKRVPSVQSISSDISSSESSTPRRKLNPGRPLSSPPVKLRSKFLANSKSKEQPENRPYASDFDESNNDTLSPISSARDTPTLPRKLGLSNHRSSNSSTHSETGETMSDEEIRRVTEREQNTVSSKNRFLSSDEQ